MTRESEKRAAQKYIAKKDRQVVYFPKGTAEAIRAQGVSVSGLCCDLVAAWLKDRGVAISAQVSEGIQGKNNPDQDEKPNPEPVQLAEELAGPHDNTIINTHTTPTARKGAAEVYNTPSVIDIDTFI